MSWRSRTLPGWIACALLFALGAWMYPGFASARLLSNLFADGAVLGVAALGTALVLLSGGIDLSVGALLALASVLFAWLVERAGVPLELAAVLVLILGATFGLMQASAIHFLALPAFIVTLSGLFGLRGLALFVAEESIAISDPRWNALSALALELGPVRVRLAALVYVGVVVCVAYALARRRTLRWCLAVGGDERAARLHGVPIFRVRALVYATAGALSALAGLLLALQSAAGNALAGQGLELDAIAVALVGGVALTGGSGGVAGSVLGVCLFGLIQNLIWFAGDLSAAWARVALGACLCAFLLLERWTRR